jgi:hypothetical protein
MVRLATGTASPPGVGQPHLPEPAQLASYEPVQLGHDDAVGRPGRRSFELLSERVWGFP